MRCNVTAHRMCTVCTSNTKNYAFFVEFFLLKMLFASPYLWTWQVFLYLFQILKFIRLYGKICLNTWSCLFVHWRWHVYIVHNMYVRNRAKDFFHFFRELFHNEFANIKWKRWRIWFYFLFFRLLVFVK